MPHYAAVSLKNLTCLILWLRWVFNSARLNATPPYCVPAAVENWSVSEHFRWNADPGVQRTHPIEPMKTPCASPWTLLFVPLLSVPVSESPSPLSLLWLGVQLWMLPLTTSVIPQQPTYPCLPPLMCDLMYCLTVFPLSKLIAVLSPQDKAACWEHNSLKVVYK